MEFSSRKRGRREEGLKQESTKVMETLTQAHF